MSSKDAQKQKDISKQIGQTLKFDLGRKSQDEGGDDSEASRSARLRKSRKQGSLSNSGGQSIKKDKHLASKQSKLSQAKGGIAKKLNAFKMFTAKALQFAWQYIWFFGLTVVILNIVAFLRLTFSNIICALGEEWTMGKQKPTSGGGGSILTTILGFLEKMGLFLVNIIIILLIIAVLSILTMISEISAHPIKFSGNAIWGWLANIFK